MKFSNKLKNGLNLPKKDKLHIQVLLATITTTGAHNLKNQKQLIKQCSKQLSMNYKSN